MERVIGITGSAMPRVQYTEKREKTQEEGSDFVLPSSYLPPHRIYLDKQEDK